EEDKRLVLAKHLEILRKIMPLHKQLAESGQVELTTTPFYHPILPLLFDKRLAREAMPEVKLPRFTGGYPEDATVHVQRAVEEHARIFGAPPKGMWPAEGSVCQPMIPLLAQHGIRWIATDEGVLSQSTQGFVSRDHHGHARNPEHLYRPYRVREGEHELGIVFRDHALSDMIGFHYQRSPGEEAAEDFFRHLHNIRNAVQSTQPALVSVILDGENCWEHYPGGGVPFLRALYRRCTQTPGIRAVKIGEHLENHPPRELGRPINRSRQRAMHSLPRTFLNVNIDGRQTFFEWMGAGRYTCQNERGTLAMVTLGPFKDVFFGFDRERLLVRIDLDRAA